MNVDIDQRSGFCFGVVHAIKAAENALSGSGEVYCLGDIVHNNLEVERLKKLGLKIIDHEQFRNLKNTTVLVRAHGEPPSTYQTAKENNIRIIDATCPIVLNLQRKIRSVSEETDKNKGQIVIYGKEGHAEVVGLKGQAPGRVIVVRDIDDLDRIDFSKPVRFFAQTTQNHERFLLLQDEIARRMRDACNGSEIDFEAYDSICRKVSNRASEIVEFAEKHDVVVFASDKKSSNGKYLYEICKSANPSTYFVSSPDELNPEWFRGAGSTGICGATSTPLWVMEEIRKRIIAL